MRKIEIHLKNGKKFEQEREDLPHEFQFTYNQALMNTAVPKLVWVQRVAEEDGVTIYEQMDVTEIG